MGMRTVPDASWTLGAQATSGCAGLYRMSWLASPTFSQPSAAHASTRIEAPLRLVKMAVPLIGMPALPRVC